MHPHGKIVFCHALEYWPKFLTAKRFARDISKDLDTASAKLPDSAINLGKRRVDVIHWQRCNEGGNMLRMFSAQLSECIVGEAREIARNARGPHQLEWGACTRPIVA